MHLDLDGLTDNIQIFSVEFNVKGPPFLSQKKENTQGTSYLFSINARCF